MHTPIETLPPKRTHFAEQIGGGPRILGGSKVMKSVLEMVDRIAKCDATVLIRGESGTGKELLADAIHAASLRARGPMVKVACAALPPASIERELFGHERGTFTGAFEERRGRFEAASGGTIFLDEIGDFSASTQIALLRLLQQQEIQRVGGSETIRVDVRLIAATSRDLEARLEDERFRQDLYYRLNVFPIHVPPLRERRQDILALTDAFAERIGRATGRSIRRITTQAIDLLMAHHWPGNVRELENCIERAVLLSTDGVLHGHHLPPTLQAPERASAEPKGTLEATLAAVEMDLLVDALEASRGNMAEAARALGLTERKMGLRVRKYAIDAERYKVRRLG
jgi:Nif-specific regulatory protein